jgi:hypothetical protein
MKITPKRNQILSYRLEDVPQDLLVVWQGHSRDEVEE